MNWNEHIELKRSKKSVAADQIKCTCQNFGRSPSSPCPSPCYMTGEHVFKVRITWSWRVLFPHLHNSSNHNQPHPIIADLSPMFAQNFYNKIDFCSFADFLYGHKNLQCKCNSDMFFFSFFFFFFPSVLVLTGTRLLVSANERKRQPLESSEIANKQKGAATERGEHRSF